MKGKKVLIVPLNWGLGHTTRIIPIIKILIDRGVDVTISGSPAQSSLLTREFKNIQVVHLPYFQMRLDTANRQIYNYFNQLPSFFIQIRKEHKALQELLKHEHFDLIISDNCYGLWNHKAKSVLITHQLNLKIPGAIRILEPLINYINRRLIRNFTFCWVPDFKDIHQNLSGQLSHPSPKSINAFYIGLLSRFTVTHQVKVENNNKGKKNILFIISGPENQRTIFENILKKQVEELENIYDFSFIRGLPDHHSEDLPEGWFNHVSAIDMQAMILQSDIIVCRSGYSSIMDLISLQKPAILIPTPGQPEQEYLAQYLGFTNLFCIQKQKNINIQKGIDALENINRQSKTIPIITNNKILMKELQNVLSGEN